MQDVLIIPTFDRPELLWLCLEYLVASPESRNLEVRVYADCHVEQAPPQEEIEAVLGMFPQLSVRTVFRPPHEYNGNSYNLLMAYRDAFESLAQHVFMIEDDVLIHPQFFTWHRAQHLGRHLGCSIAVENPGHGVYASLGVCFRREILRNLMPHCRPEYFQNMRGYCKAKFPPSKFDCEQDGLLARILSGQPVVWATEPMAQHVGWYGYHRKRSIRPTGTLLQRYEQVKRVLSNRDILQSWVRDFGDIQVI